MIESTPSRMTFSGLLTNTAFRHLSVGLAAAGLVLAFGAVHGQWSPMHRWNRAFGDASLVLIALSMAVGPLARLFRPAVRWLRFRRELGVYGCILALVHAVIILVGWVQWDLMRLFGFEWHPGLGAYVMFQPGFGLANAIGLAALVLAAVLALTSNDVSQRRLGSSAWKFLQMGALPLWWLTIAHVAYFLFMHFLSFHRQTPEPNPLQLWMIGLVGAVLALRAAAYLRTVFGKPAAPRTGEVADGAPR